ncbi:MAG: sulfatase-like hydrolase/transferase, partial [Acidimicrobiales bacterium]|nr:sulfatase-like hydrolase/transferase [Acidimicrobiales bacterium]
LVLDELPLVSLLDEDDRIDPAQFPNLARLSGDATLFRNATSVAPSTPEAVPAILTGRYPTDPDALPDSREYPDNLFTLLGATYQENVWEGVTQLCPDDVCPERDGGQGGGPLGSLLDDAVDVWRRHVSPDRSDGQVTFQVRQSNPNAPLTVHRFVDSLEAAADRPRLDFLHVLYPHQPWFHTPTGAVYDAPFVAEGLDSTYRWRDQQVADAGRQRHLLQLQHADAVVGDVLDRMEELGTYDESLIVVTADHGVSFLAGEPIRGVSSQNYHQVMWTPLLVKEPRQTEGTVDDRPLSAVDVLPTIADVLDVEVPWDLDGRSARSGPPREDGRRRFFEWTLNALRPTDGPYVEVDGPTGFQRMLDEPPPGRGGRAELRFYRFGEWGPLVGRHVDELDVAGGARLSGRLDRASAYRDVDRRSGEVPAYVSGDVRTSDGDVSTVAVAVNGTIAGWSHLHAGDVGAPEWYTMVPEWFLVGGDNRIDLYEVAGTPDDPRLTPVSLS